MAERLTSLEGSGLARESIAVDPGIAFGKSHDEDLQVLRRLAEFRLHGQPLLIAHSRKNFLGSVSGLAPAERDLQTHMVSVLAYEAGARLFRVHDVAGTRKALEIAQALLEGAPGDFAPSAESWPWRAGATAAHMTAGAPDKAAPGGQRW
jgi:dihydropteroate synthase